MKQNWIKSFIKLAGAILLAAALVRFFIAAGSSPVLLLPEPMLGIPLRYAVLIVGVIELTVALICLFGEKFHFQVGWLAWLATNLMVFWIGLFWMNCQAQATCIGSLTDPLHLSRGTIGFITRFLPICMLLGSYIALFQLLLLKKVRMEDRTAQSVLANPHANAADSIALVQFLKVSCSTCNGHIEFPIHALGQITACPHCAASVTLQMPR